AVLLALLAVRAGRIGLARVPGTASGPPGELLGYPSFLAGVRDYLTEGGLLRPRIGLVGRLLVRYESTDARVYQLAHADHRTFVLRVDGAIDQLILRNLLIWQNHVLRTYPDCADGRAVDLLIRLAGNSGDEPRLSDLISAALMLEQVRNVSVFW